VFRLPSIRSVSSRQLAALFAASALLPSVLLMVLGWRLLQQESALEERRQQEVREQSADLVVTALAAELTQAEDRLQSRPADDLTSTTASALLLTLSEAGLQTAPEGLVLHVPEPVRLPEVPPDRFVAADAAEYQLRDPHKALEELRSLAASRVREVEAGAFLGIARIQRGLGRLDDAVSAYREAAGFNDVAMHGIPAGLLARRGLCTVLEIGGRTGDLRREAAELEERLLAAHWSLGSAIFEAQMDDLRRWLGREPAVSDSARAATQAAAAIWASWREGRFGEIVKRNVLRIENSSFTVLARDVGGSATVLVASPRFVEERWLRAARRRVREGFDVRIEYSLQNGTSRQVARRSAVDSGLPWTVLVSGSDPQSAALLRRRQTLWLAGVGVMLLLIASGAYLMQRLVARELAVARLKSDFVAAVSHEFRTPLTSMRQLSEMLVDAATAPVDRRLKYYDALQRQTERLQRLVESLLDFSRLESGTAIYSRRPLDLASLGEGVAAEFRSDPAARGHRIEFRGTRASWISGDPEPLRNALWNLLDNAAKYSPAPEPIFVEIAVDGDEVVLRVCDHGSGVPLHEQTRIFEKFVRGEQARHDGVSGTGVGLAVVQQIVRAHDGSVELSSTPGQGATFAMRFPSVSASRIQEAAECLES
jgi:signal transduction histidine kinase